MAIVIGLGADYEKKDPLGLYSGTPGLGGTAPQQPEKPQQTAQSAPEPVAEQPKSVPAEKPLDAPRAGGGDPTAKGFARLAPPVPESPKARTGGGGNLRFVNKGQHVIAPAFRNILEETSAELGRDFTVTSGYRSPNHPVEKRKKKGPGEHSRRTASDISIAGMSDAERTELVQSLRARGVKRFGIYKNTPNILHVDMKDQAGDGSAWFMYDRSKNNLHRAPAWFQAVAGTKAPPAKAVAEKRTAAVKLDDGFKLSDPLGLYRDPAAPNPFQKAPAPAPEAAPVAQPVSAQPPQPAAPPAEEGGRFKTITADQYDQWKADWEARNRSGGVAGDVGRMLTSGSASLGLAAREAVGMIPGVGPSIVKGLEAVDEWLTGTAPADRMKDAKRLADSSVTAEQGAADRKDWVTERKNPDGTITFLPGPAWADPRSYLRGVAGSAPSTIATMGPTGLLARGAFTGAIARGATQEVAAAQAARTALIAGGVSEGILGGAETSMAVKEQIAALPRQVLEQSTAIQELVNGGMTFEQAVEAAGSDAGTQAFIIGGAATAAFGGYGDRVLAKILAEGVGGSVGKRILAGGARGAVGEGVFEEAPQSAAQQAATNYGVQGVDPSQSITEGVPNAAAGGMAAGGVMGGGLGAAGGAMAGQPVPPAPQPAPAPRGPLGKALDHGERAAVEQVARNTPQPMPAAPPAGAGPAAAPSAPPAAAAPREGFPAIGSTVRIDSEGIEPFMATVEGIEGDEVVVFDRSSGEVYQIPVGETTQIADPPAEVAKVVQPPPVPKTISKGMRANLGDLGWTPDQIGNMTPLEADMILRENRNPPRPTVDANDEALEPAEAKTPDRKVEQPAAKELIPVTQHPRGAPAVGSSVMVDGPDGRFAAKVEGYEGEGADREALVVDDNGTPLQVPIGSVLVSRLTEKEAEAERLKREPPVDRTEEIAGARNARKVGKHTVSFPDDVSARIYDIGRERQTSIKLAGAGKLDRDAVMPAAQRKLADELGVTPEGMGQIADDYRYRIERAAKQARSDLPTKALPVNSKMLKRFRADKTGPDVTNLAEEVNEAPLDVAAAEAATSPKNDLPEPTQAQKEAGNYKVGHARLGGLDLSIENPAGSTRKGTSRSGKAWSVKMKSHYGYIRGTVGRDKDHIDTFIKSGTAEISDDAPVFVVDQRDPARGQFDEHKVMLGFKSKEEAEKAYLENYAKGWRGLGKLTETTHAGFKRWLAEGDTRKPFRAVGDRVPDAGKKVEAPPAVAPATLSESEKKWIADHNATRDIPIIQEMIARAELAARQEKQSDPADWSAEEKAAYRRGDTRRFSELRGYTEAEISNHERYLELANQMIEKHGVDFVASLTLDRDQSDSWDTAQSEPGAEVSQPRETEEDVLKRMAERHSVKEFLEMLVTKPRAQVAAVIDRKGRIWEITGTSDLDVNPNAGAHGHLFTELYAANIFPDWPVAKNFPYAKISRYGTQIGVDSDELNDAQIAAAKALIASAEREGISVVTSSNFDVAIGTEAATTKPSQNITENIPASAEVTKAVTPPRPPKPKKQPLILRLENYFRVGRDVPAYGGGTDRVISFNRDGQSRWRVRVANVRPDGNLDAPRTHETIPSEREMARWERDNPVPVHPKGESQKARKADPAPLPPKTTKEGNAARVDALFASNKLFTVDKVEAARARLKAKMGQINSGIDPEVLLDGMTITGAYVEAGVRSFAAYAKQMSEDFGPTIRPYLLSFWEAVRNYPGLDAKGMTPSDEAARLHAEMNRELPAEAAAALGSELAKPAKKTKKSGRPEDRILTQDWGVEHIDGYGTDSSREIGNDVKDAFLKDASQYLQAVAGILADNGFVPKEDAKGRAMKPVSKNEAGPAVSGEAWLHMRHADSGSELIAQVGGSSLRGVVPTTPSGVSVMYRLGKTGINRWAPVGLSAGELGAMIVKEAGGQIRAADIARPAVEAPDGQVQSAVQAPDRTGVSQDAPGREPAAQQAPARAHPGDVEARKPENVGRARKERDDGQLGLRFAAEDVGPSGNADGGRDGGDRRTRDRGARAPDAAAGSPGPVDPGLVVKAPETVSPANAGPGDFHIDDPLRVVGGGQVARFEKNRAAIELRNRLVDEGRNPTREEQETLAGYTGWGSFGQELFQGTWANPKPKDGWQARDTWLRENLGQTDWEGMQRSIINAHYTDPPTVLAMWDMVRRMGFTGGRVLEPSIGIGNFFGMMPADMASRSQRSGIELDPVTGSMAQLLYPQANIQIKGYEQSQTPDNFFDLVIGNWPFADYSPADRRYNRLNPLLHDYFFLKALDQTRPGGLVVGITTKGTMDKKASGVRAEMAKKAELVAAFRLPTGAFEEYAGTKVVTDILILRKRAEPAGIVADEGWINVKDHPTREGTKIPVNEYFHNNPSHVIGEIDFGHGTTTFRPGLVVHRPADVAGELRRVIDLVPEGAYQADQRGKTVTYLANHTSDRTNSLTKTKDGLFVVRGEHLQPANEVQKYAVKDPKGTAEREAELSALIDMRGLYAKLMDAERTGDATDERKALREAFQAFRKQFGNYSNSFGLTYLRKLDDPFYPALAALETSTPNEKGGRSYRPAAILTESTTRGRKSIDKPSIADAFVLARNEAVNPAPERIAELAGKSVAEVRKALIDSGAAFETPAGEFVPADIYLSGNVREALRQARAGREEGNEAMDRNIAALQAVVPADIPYYKIETQFGATWVPQRVYADYVAHMLGMTDAAEIKAGFNAGSWQIDFPSEYNHRIEARAGFGTEHVKFKRLVRAAIANQTINVRKKDEKGDEYIDADASKEANARISEIRLKFAEWLWSDPERRLDLEREYNETRNAYATPSFDGSFLSFEGMALTLGRGPFNLREHQVNAIWRGLVTRRSLNAHEVGTGKTFTMGGIAVESRRYGIARKPLLFAHNANSKTVAHEIQQMYPGAKVLYVDNLAKENVKVRMMQIANDDWDVVVFPHSLIDRIGFKEETLMAMAAQDIADLELAAEEAAAEDNVQITPAMFDDPEELKKLRSPTAKQLVKQRQRIIETVKKLSQQASRPDAIAFEDLGVDMVLVDEAHEFKKPPIATKMNMKGLQTQVSNRSIAMSFITAYVRGMNNGGNVHLFTGTPITNTMTEVFHMMRYMMKEEMEAVSLADWDGWFGSFAREVEDVELSSTNEYETVTRLQSFINVPELRRMIGQYMDVVFSDDMPEMRPRSINGKTLSDPSLTEAERVQLLNGRTEGASDRPYKKVFNESADMSPRQMEVFGEVQTYARRWREMGKKQRRDAMAAGAKEVPIIHDQIAEKASFDVRLVESIENAGKEGTPEMAPDPASKPARVVAKLLEIYHSHPDANQVVFMEQGMARSVTRSEGPAGEKRPVTYKAFSTLVDMIERLVQAGVPRDQIAAVTGATSKDRRKEIADQMNSGQIRIVFGSTDSLGVGVNMQKNLRAMHHMDAPWMPGELEQRNGRGHRQGNQWNTVREYRYLTDRLDGRRWQVLAIKQRFITDFMKSKGDARVIEGDAASDEQSDILSTFSDAAGDPRILVREKLKKKIEALQSRQRLHSHAQADALRQVRKLRDRMPKTEAQLAALEKSGAVEKAAAILEQQRGDTFRATILGKEFTSSTEAADFIHDELPGTMRVGQDKQIGTFAGEPLHAHWGQFGDSPDLYLQFGDRRVESLGSSMRSLMNKLRDLRDKVRPELEAELERDRGTIARMEAASTEPFHLGDQLGAIQSQLGDLETDIERNPVAPPFWLRSGAPPETAVFWKDRELTVTGHRWTDDGYFVLAEDAEGAVAIPYMDARDAQGMTLYEEHPFVAPVVITKDEKKAPADAQADVTPAGWGSVGDMEVPTLSDADRAEVDRIIREVSGLPEAKFWKKIVLPNGAKDWGTTDPSTAGGFYSPSQDVIVVALDSQNGPRVAYHEAFHRLQHLFLTDAEKAVLRAEVGRLRRIVAGTFGREKQAAKMSQKELEAEAFAIYAVGQTDVKPHKALAAAWDRIKAAIRRVMNYLAGRGLMTAEDVFDAARAGSVAGGRAPRARAAASAIEPSLTPDAKGKVPGMIRQLLSKPTDWTPAALAMVPFNYFTELKRPNMTAVDTYLRVKRTMDAYRGKKHAAMDEVSQEWRKYARLGWGPLKRDGRARAAELADLMHEATLAGVDPSSTAEEVTKDPKYPALRARYTAMPRAGQELFRKVRDAYAAQASEVDQILLDNIRKSQVIAAEKAAEQHRLEIERIRKSRMSATEKQIAEDDANKAYAAVKTKGAWSMKARLTRMRTMFEASRVPVPYFPLARFGRYFVAVRDIDGSILSFSKRETVADRDRLAAELRSAYPNADIDIGVMDVSSSAREAMDPRLVAEIEAIVGGAGIDPGTMAGLMDQIWQRYLETLPDLSTRKRFIHRKGTAGFDADALRAFASHMFHAAHQMGRLKYGLDLQELSNMVADQAKRSDDPTRGVTLANELKLRHEWVMNPMSAKWSQAINSIAFTWMLGATPAAAMVNMTQTPMMGIPILGARLGGVTKAAAALVKASADSVRGWGSVTRSNLSADERAAMDAFLESGLIDRTQSHDLAGVGETGVEYSPLRAKVMATIALAYHHAEVWNREVTALAAYRMARAQGQNEAQAIDTAHDLTWKVHFDYSNASRARFLQGDTAKAVFVFQSHTLNMTYRLLRDVHQAFKGESPQARKEARTQIFGILGMMSLMAGTTGVFGYTVLMTLAGMVFGDDDDPLKFEEQFQRGVIEALGPTWGGMVLKGVPGHLTGIDLTGRIGMPYIWLRPENRELEGRDQFESLVMRVLGANVGMLGNWWHGASVAIEGQTARGVEIAAPKAVKDAMKAYRYLNEGITNLKGDQILDISEIDAWDAIATAAGFTPAKVAETYDRISALKGAEQRMLDRRGTLVNRYALAARMGDDEARKEAIEAIKRFNAVPSNGPLAITPDTLRRSLKIRARNAAKREDGVLIQNERLSRDLRKMLPEPLYR